MEINKQPWNDLKKGNVTPDKFVSDLNIKLANFLESKVEFQHQHKEYFKYKPANTKLLDEITKKKRELNKKARTPETTAEYRSEANQAIRMHSYLKKRQAEKEELKLTKEQEKAFRNNFWKTAKDVTNGNFGNPPSEPTFSKITADTFYKERYETPTQIDLEKLEWFPKVEKPTIPYNLKP